MAENRGLKLYETPVGFKFIGELINKDEIILGGEESAGLSIKGHYPEKDGIIACLLAAEAVAAREKSLTTQLNELYRRVGKLESGRIGVRLTPEIQKILPEKLAQEPGSFGERKVEIYFHRRQLAADAALGNGTDGSHLCRSRNKKRSGGAA